MCIVYLLVHGGALVALIVGLVRLFGYQDFIGAIICAIIMILLEASAS